MKNKDKLLRLSPWLIAAAVAILAFALSAQDSDASHMTSRWFSNRLYKGLTPVIATIQESLDWELRIYTDTIVRKIVHIIIYYALTILIIIGLRFITNYKPVIFTVSFLIVLLLACADEFFQLFSSGRGASATDVLLDMAGAALAQISALLAILIRKIKFPDKK